MSLLHVFDMDGTLLRGTTASIEIARELGCLGELMELEHNFSTGQIDTHQFATQVHRLWGALTLSDVTRIVEKAPWISGLKEVLEDIRFRHEYSLVVTLSPDFFAEHLRSMGADIVVASRFPALPFKEKLDVAGILSPTDKVTIVEQKLSEYGLDRLRCIAYGDSSSDIPLFQAIPHTVSVNGDKYINPWSRLRYAGNDLRDAYSLARNNFFTN
ncbi:HAD family hydrolase [Xenorhabdus thuongxuanensis]|uniref:Phosphoserine phosphatase n=1 Tax=Xenorhabdus thuongxuanensis TaxID=1873484 RepID=A0A1Q5U7Q0_9GAMM|nr:HAD-IB family phosphatase [Xenorhabdus thuongxuanensis]OKP08481.1 Phosphoserine phosphatase [Xenorhabdus thuongxuanensis]